jgi:hypothetical protein
VPYLLNARTVEPEKQPLLVNGSETIFVSRQRFAKHVPAATDKHATPEVLLETMFPTRSVETGYKKNWGKRVSSLRESVKKRICSWKGAAVQEVLEHGSRGLAIIRSRYRAITCDGTAGQKRLLKRGNQRWRCN